jgi:hypothetical protein
MSSEERFSFIGINGGIVERIIYGTLQKVREQLLVVTMSQK